MMRPYYWSAIAKHAIIMGDWILANNVTRAQNRASACMSAEQHSSSQRQLTREKSIEEAFIVYKSTIASYLGSHVSESQSPKTKSRIENGIFLRLTEDFRVVMIISFHAKCKHAEYCH